MNRLRIPFTTLAIAASLCGCARKDARTTSASSTLDACTAALAAGPDRSDRDRMIARLQEQVRGGGDSALERLGYAYVARAGVNGDPGDYKLAEAAASCLEARRPDDPMSAEEVPAG